MEKDTIVDNFISKYSLEKRDKEFIEKIIKPIINHVEFKKRFSFLHHGNITLGEHIIEDAVLTYKLSKKKNIRQDLAVKIAMFHDLYTVPWQNNKDARVNKFFHKHGFRHPVEAIINSINWYPEYFNDENDSKIIIDGILHHMFPLPVMRLNENNISNSELKNVDLYFKIPYKHKLMILDSLNRKKIGPVSLGRSKYLEGRIMSKADRIVSRGQIKNFSTAKSLLTGHNKKIK